MLKLKPHVEKLLSERYYLKHELSWEQLSRRISDIHTPMYDYILNRVFIPSTPTLMNLNTNGERNGTLSSCFILGMDDSIDSIMNSMKDAAIVTKMTGGVGFNFSKLRGANENVKSISANSGGVMSFINIFDSVLDGIRQGGKRRGAGMSMLSIYHPDILSFIDAKVTDTTKYTRSNFSVCTDSIFYEVLKKSPTKLFKTRNVVDGKDRILTDSFGTEYTYKMLWDKIIHNAWLRAEPGIFNGEIAADRCSCKHITREVFSNPCSEYTHIPYTSCNLGSINLSSFVVDDKFDWKSFETIIENSVIYLNGVIDNNQYPIEKIKIETMSVRPIGLGEMGLAHLLYLLKIPYDSDMAMSLSTDINRYMTTVSMRKSMELARDRNKTYNYYNYDVFMDANARFFDKDEFMGIDLVELKSNIKKYGVHNSCFTSIAPTGTISYIADCSGGMEPVFGLVFTRKIEKDNKSYEHVYIVDPIFEKYIEKTYPGNKIKIYEYISNNKGSCQGCTYLTDSEKQIFKVAGDITPRWHLNILSAVANNVSLSVSKTINLPKNCSEKEIGDIFIDAHKMGVIGVTVYRDESREGILVHKKDSESSFIQRRDAPKRPDDLDCDIHEMNVMLNGKSERFVSLVGKLSGTVYEIFVTRDLKNKLDFNKHKRGIIRKIKKGRYDLIVINGEEQVKIEDISSVFGGQLGTLSRLVSMSLRHGTPLQIIVDQLQKNTMSGFFDFDRCVSRVLKHYIKEGEIVITSDICPECKSKLIYVEGCKSCSDKECGYTACK